MKGTSL